MRTNNLSDNGSSVIIKPGDPIEADIPRHGNYIWSLAYSTDGKEVVTGGSETTLRRWNAKTMEPLGKLMCGHTGAVFSVCYAPNGREICSGSDNGTLRRWDARTGEQIGEPMLGYGARIRSICYSPDGTEFIGGGEKGTLFRWAGRCVNEPLKIGRDKIKMQEYKGFDI